ncbi:MAG: alanine--glyoxylate aminotransferase family protein, partial [Asgard group archaeon]|nr:alanine--glyoxylate aminotransferase family protein [Asgard group archaeon]
VIHCETPSGTLNPIKEIGKVCRKSNAIFISDSVSSIAGTTVKTEEWDIDIHLGASQKCISAPPGIAFMSLSDKALEVINTRESIPTFYSDLSIWTKSWIANRKMPFTHSISNLYSFREAVDLIHEEGLDNVIKRHQKISQAMIAAVESIGLEIFPKTKDIVSPTITALKTPEGIDSNKLVDLLWRKYGVLIAGAWGPEISGKVLRLGNMGYGANPHFAVIALAALEKALQELGFKIKNDNIVGTFMEKI